MEEKTTSFKKNANGSYSKKGVVRQTPKDGFVEHDGPGGLEYRKGHGVWWTYETDDPKVTRPCLYIFFALFMGLWNGIFYSCSQGMDPSGRMYVFFGCLRDIRKREKQQQEALQKEREAKRRTEG